MKHLLALTALLGLLSIAGVNSALAKAYGGAGGGPKPTAEGTISDIGSRGFTITVTDPAAARKPKTDDTPAASTEKTMKVQCDNNTKFQTGGEPSDGSIVKAGAHVAVFGSVSGDTIMAQTVDLVTEKHKKK